MYFYTSSALMNWEHSLKIVIICTDTISKKRILGLLSKETPYSIDNKNYVLATGGGKKGNAGWHRDTQYWPFWKPDGVFTAWIALTDVVEESGPVRYICGSNEWERVEGLDFFNKNISEQDEILKRAHEDYDVVSANIKKGQISIHTSRVYHSSRPNISNDPRIGMVVHFCTDIAERIPISGENSDYLNKREDESICPVIYSR